jgi:molybdate transport system substrate-binding protein
MPSAHRAPMKQLHLLSGGAAQGLVTQVRQGFETQHECELHGIFGAVGAMKDSLLAGTPCDVVILTDKLVRELTISSYLLQGSRQAIGVVKTGIAVKSGDRVPAVGTDEELKTALRAASAIYFPDPVRATAGIHVMRVLKQLGLDDELAAKLHPFPDGATAMRAMAESEAAGQIGCTQVTEILFTDGVQLVAPLPQQFELATVYSAAVCAASSLPVMARDFIALLVSDEVRRLRTDCGFEA